MNGGRLVRGAPVEVVDAFLMAFRNHEGSPTTETEPVRNYIRVRQADELAEWDVLFAGVTPQRAERGSLEDSSLGFRVICQRRAEGRRSDDGMLMITSKQRVSSRGIERTGLAEEAARGAEEDYDERNPPPSGPSIELPGLDLPEGPHEAPSRDPPPCDWKGRRGSARAEVPSSHGASASRRHDARRSWSNTS